MAYKCNVFLQLVILAGELRFPHRKNAPINTNVETWREHPAERGFRYGGVESEDQFDQTQDQGHDHQGSHQVYEVLSEW